MSGLIAILLSITFFALPAFATPSQHVDISDFNVELIAGGVVGEETTIRITACVTAEAKTDITIRKDMAVCQGRIKYFIIDSNWSLIAWDKIEEYTRYYEYPSYNGNGAHAVFDWQPVIDYTWTPNVAGKHYISAEVFGHTAMTDGSWPPKWITEFKREYHYEAIEIIEPLTAGWVDDGSFEVSIGDNFGCHATYEFDGLILGESISQECLVAGHVVGLQMTAETMILGTDRIWFNYDGNDITVELPQSAIFSKLVTITIDGLSVLTFTEISGGVPQ